MISIPDPLLLPKKVDDVFRTDCAYEWKCHRYAHDDPHKATRCGLMTIREYRAHNRPSLFRTEIQPWLSVRSDWYFSLPEGPLIGSFATREACETALRLTAGIEILP